MIINKYLFKDLAILATERDFLRFSKKIGIFSSYAKTLNVIFMHFIHGFECRFV